MARLKLELQPVGATDALDLNPGPATLAVGKIRQRKDEDTRGLSAGHVVELAECLAALGLLEPIVIDTKGHLLAGGHRLAAAQLLAIEDGKERRKAFLDRVAQTMPAVEGDDKPKKKGADSELMRFADRIEVLPSAEFLSRHPRGQIPVAVNDVTGKDGKSLALAIEVAENTVRRAYTRDEIRDLAKRLKLAGYRTSAGRPKEGEVSAISMLQAAVGKSRKTIDRILKGKESNSKSGWDNAVATFLRASKRILEEGKSKRGENDVKLLELVRKARKLAGGGEDGSE